MSGRTLLALSDTVISCWTAALAGVAVAAVAWIAVVGGRAVKRQREGGRLLAAGLGAVAIAVWLVVGLAGVAYGVNAVLPR